MNAKQNAVPLASCRSGPALSERSESNGCGAEPRACHPEGRLVGPRDLHFSVKVNP